jgi:hypothetical protein
MALVSARPERRRLVIKKAWHQVVALHTTQDKHTKDGSQIDLGMLKTKCYNTRIMSMIVLSVIRLKKDSSVRSFVQAQSK